jgi:hypothetical protein
VNFKVRDGLKIFVLLFRRNEASKVDHFESSFIYSLLVKLLEQKKENVSS